MRIEDTDRARSTEAAITAILDGLSWLGLDHDGEVFYQHARADRHREAVDQLLAAGKAYYCYARRTNSPPCASRPAPRGARCAMTGAGVIAIPPKRRKA